MTGQQIIDDFDKLTDEMSELSAAQKLALAENKYRDVLNDRDWEFLRKVASVTIASSEVDLSGLSDSFRNFAENDKEKTGHRFGFWIGTSFYPVVNMQDRRTHDAMSYFDLANTKIVLPSGLSSLNGSTASVDYFYKPAALAVGTSPIFNSDYHKVISYLMAGEHYLIDQTEAGRNQKQVYDSLAQDVLEDMQYEDDQYKEDWISS
jgi:hypothetical protein